MRRIAAIASVLLAASAITAGGAAVASAATNAGPLAGAAVTNAGSIGTAGVTCSEPLKIENSYDGGNGQWFWNATSSPYTLRTHTSGTGYCITTVSGPTKLIQYGTSRCLTIDTASKTVTEGSCSRPEAVINFIAVGEILGTPTVEVQFFDVTKDCIYQAGRESPVTYHPCSPGETSDVWILF